MTRANTSSYLGPGETRLGRKGSVRDTARVLGRMFDGIEYRGFDHESVETLAAHTGVSLPAWPGPMMSFRGPSARLAEGPRNR